MTLDNYVSFIGLLLVALQLRENAKQTRENTKQLELQSLDKIHDTNDDLLTIGFFVPELFDVLEDKAVDPIVTRRCLQLWFNFFLRVHSYLEKAVFKGDLGEKLIRDLSGFLKLKNAQHFWSEYRFSYPASFQKLVEDNIEKSRKHEPPPPTAAALEG